MQDRVASLQKIYFLKAGILHSLQSALHLSWDADLNLLDGYEKCHIDQDYYLWVHERWDASFSLAVVFQDHQITAKRDWSNCSISMKNDGVWNLDGHHTLRNWWNTTL